MARDIQAHETYEVGKFIPKRMRDVDGVLALGLEVHGYNMLIGDPENLDVFYLAFRESVWEDLMSQIREIMK